jgi:multidrug resistance efflux pump/transcriptional regulator with GAF, ATPase, and Fis domain
MPDATTPVTESTEVAARLFATTSVASRAKLLATTAASLTGDTAAAIYLFNSEAETAAWRMAASTSDISLVQQLDWSTVAPLAALLEDSENAFILADPDLTHEHYQHLNIGRPITSTAYLPMIFGETLMGAIEIISFSKEVTLEDLETLQPLAEIGAPALREASLVEGQQADLLDSVHRMTQLYDLEKSLNATLDLDPLMLLIPRKVIAMLHCQAIHLWLFNGDDLTLMSSAGADPTVAIGLTQSANEGYVGQMAEEGVATLITDPEDERLRIRGAGSEYSVWSAMLVPLMQEEAEVGVLEAINRNDGEPFDEDDEFFFGSVAETVSSALKNASLMHAERKLEILEALVHVSSEITSTLRLERLLQIIVNSPQNVLPFERCSIALDNRGKLQLKSISGMSSIPIGDAQVEGLLDLVRWLSTQSGAIHIRQHEETDLAELPAEVTKHFEATGYRALYALSLNDDQGRVGVLLYESSDPDFLDLPHTEMIKILAGQATVAIRNALLYREVPLISILEPLMQRKQALLRTTKGRRIGFIAGTVLAVLFLVFCPLPMRLTGEATVAPQRLVSIASPIEGNVNEVFAREGQRVEAGQALGGMNDYQWRIDLASAEGRYRTALLGMQSDLARGAAQAGMDRSQTEYLRAEADRARAKIDNAQLRSPISGIVMTPSIQDAAGEHLDAGATFAQVLDLSSAIVNVAIPQADAALLQPGQRVAIKLDSYPQRSWHGSVSIVSLQATAGDGERTFTARVALANDDATLRAGMTGRAKISTGYRPAGYVLLRRPALWIWQTLWNWFGW